MKNLKLIMLSLGFCALLTPQTTFAQEDSRAATEKADLNKARNNQSLDVSNLKEQQLKVLRKKYDEATPEQQVAIKEEIKALKKSYNKEVKGVDGDHISPADVERKKLLKEAAANKTEVLEEKYDMSDKQMFINKSRKRIKAAKIRLEEDAKSGNITEEEIRKRKYKIGQVEKKLNQYETSISDAKVQIAKRIEEIKQLQD